MKKRISFFDNAKAILIFLVMFGHFIEPIRQTDEYAMYLYKFIYSFHMPFFIMISGYFSKRDNFKGDLKILGLYIIFQIFYTNMFMDKIIYFTPKMGLWYLFALFLWRNIIRYLRNTKHPLLISVLIGLICGYSSEIGGFLALSRVFTFLPYFTLGYLINKEFVLKVTSLIKARYAFIALLIMFIVTVFVTRYFNLTYRNWWFAGDKTYEKLILNETLIKYGFLYQGIVYIISLVMVILVASLIPKSNVSILGKIGKGSIYIYIGQIFFTKYFLENNFYEKYNLQMYQLFIISLILIMILQLPSFIKKMYNNFQNSEGNT